MEQPPLPIGWAGPAGPLGRHISKQKRRTLAAYAKQPRLVLEHANAEADTATGGYAHRQLYELIQNGADALSPLASAGSSTGEVPAAAGRVTVLLTADHLYCADDGAAIDAAGVDALLFAHLSPKRATSQIGTFGLGFKSVLGVTDSPAFFSHSGSFQFDRGWSHDEIQGAAPKSRRTPVLRLAHPLDPVVHRKDDGDLEELMEWATNVVRLPLKPGAHEDLLRQVKEFPQEFLLFVDHVRALDLAVPPAPSRRLTLAADGATYTLTDGGHSSRWFRVALSHRLSEDARADRRAGEEAQHVALTWAAPLDDLRRPGRFWSFFPTQASSLIPGILNAPWKTNEDRYNLLPGPYNDDLIRAAARLVAAECPRLSTTEDPARHLDILPRRHEPGDSEHANLLRTTIFRLLHTEPILPDQNGMLRQRGELSYYPREFTRLARKVEPAIASWCDGPIRPADWLHHSALKANRPSAVDRLFHPAGMPATQHRGAGMAPWSSVGQWLEALVSTSSPTDAPAASRHALITCSLLPERLRAAGPSIGRIVLTATGHFEHPDPEQVFLAADSDILADVFAQGSLVHPDVMSDATSVRLLKDLGLRPPSADVIFRSEAKELMVPWLQATGDTLSFFWRLSRHIDPQRAFGILHQALEDQRNRHPEFPVSFASQIRVRTQAKRWCPLHSALTPGAVLGGAPHETSESAPTPAPDARATVDTKFHNSDLRLLKLLGAVAEPQESVDVSAEPWQMEFRERCRDDFIARLDKNPRRDLIRFTKSNGPGPVEVLQYLSSPSKVKFTERLLDLPGLYQDWEMKHATQQYPPLICQSPYFDILRRHGRIPTSAPEGVPFEDALGSRPRSMEALRVLLKHRNTDRLRKVFELHVPSPNASGESDPIPLFDVWPGLRAHLREQGVEIARHLQLVDCETILLAGERVPATRLGDCVYLDEDIDDEAHRLQLVNVEGNLGLTGASIRAVLAYERQQGLERRREAVRRQTTDAGRLLEAVGLKGLRGGLPPSLLEFIESEPRLLSGLDIAEAAIATWHTDALRKHREDLEFFDPPLRWAGSQRAVRFVHSLGFSDEWAGERQQRSDPFLEVEGRYTLPPLHDYQETIAGRIRQMLRGKGRPEERRGLVSLPTGSGKTRVTVQAIVEAMRDDGFSGGVLWVADRGELCEQAVESWQQVWSAIGPPGVTLRISRMWQGQQAPRQLTRNHVVATTIQTLHAKTKRHLEEYRFLSRFSLAVFDEAHRSIARTFTEAMRAIGLTRYKRRSEPFLLGLTATPYRGHDATETARLVARYGRNRLDAGAFPTDDPQEVIQTLQQQEILAEADHETIEGVTLSRATLDEQEWEALSDALGRNLPWLPHSIEDRIARSVERTRSILAAYFEHVEEDWPTIIFGTSVEHSRTLAALLSRRGVPARAVSGDTKAGTRRDIVEQFRDGKLRVLVNYGIFREGFDAPKTRAIIVARPVYSPNLYFQMVGRGLRGKKNGGSERCLVLNVRDNIENYDRALAFSELDWLWS